MCLPITFSTRQLQWDLILGVPRHNASWYNDARLRYCNHCLFSHKVLWHHHLIIHVIFYRTKSAPLWWCLVLTSQCRNAPKEFSKCSYVNGIKFTLRMLFTIIKHMHSNDLYLFVFLLCVGIVRAHGNNHFIFYVKRLYPE